MTDEDYADDMLDSVEVVAPKERTFTRRLENHKLLDSVLSTRDGWTATRRSFALRRPVVAEQVKHLFSGKATDVELQVIVRPIVKKVVRQEGEQQVRDHVLDGARLYHRYVNTIVRRQPPQELRGLTLRLNEDDETAFFRTKETNDVCVPSEWAGTLLRSSSRAQQLTGLLSSLSTTALQAVVRHEATRLSKKNVAKTQVKRNRRRSPF